MSERVKNLIEPQKKGQIFGYLAFSGILSGFCMAFPSLLGAVIEWLAFIPAALAFYCASKNNVGLKRAFDGGFWLIYTQNVIVYHWFFSFYPLEFTGMTKLAAAGVVLVAVLGLPILAAIFGGLGSVLTLLISRTSSAKKYPITLPFVFASTYVLCEWIRTKFWFGVPWGRLSLGQLTDGVPISVLSSSILGSYFVTFLIVLASALLAQALFCKRAKLRTIIAAGLIAANLLCGAVIAVIPSNEETCVKVAAIQANINSRDKWSGTYYDIMVKYQNLTNQAASDGAELIVWPETAVLYNEFIPDIASLAKDLKVYILFGCFDYMEDGAPKNILCLVCPDGSISETAYAKRHLVPFGEYVPMRDLITTVFPPLGEIAMLSEDLVPGDESALYEIEIDGKSLKVGGLICFDSIYEELAYTTSSDGADFICVATNDSWFEDSRAVYMHCAQSRLRAIETGLPILRAANTGISAGISSLGEIEISLDPLVEGVMVYEISVSDQAGNSNIGNSVFLIVCFLLLVALPLKSVVDYLIKKK